MGYRSSVLVAVFLLLALPSCTGAQKSTGSTAMTRIERIMHAPRYAHSRWGLMVEDTKRGAQIHALNADQSFVPGSTTKLFTISAAWNTLGPNHRFVTPVYRTGPIVNGTLRGNLVLVASGDLTMGGRTKPDGTVDVANFDHADANAIPGLATLTPEDPLAGLKELAKGVKAAGIARVDGNVIVDDRLFETDRFQNPEVPTSPIIINDNLIDTLSTPTTVGQRATLSWRPHTGAYKVTSTVTTGPKGSSIALNILEPSPGVLTVSGSVPAGHAPVVHTYQVQDPASFARSAFIDTLHGAGVQSTVPDTAPNPTASLPARGSYSKAARVAAFTSPPYSQYAKLILKVSLNLGANLSMCLLAVHGGSRNCEDGPGQEAAFLRRVGVDSRQVALNDGQGQSANDLVTPRAVVQLLRTWPHRGDFKLFKSCLPILGVDGSLSTVQTRSPARGHVFAKTGTLAAVDLTNSRITLEDKSLAGYIDTRDGRSLVFSLYMNNMPAESVNGVLVANDDLGAITSILYSEKR